MVRRMRKLAKKMHKRDTPPRKVTDAPYISHPAAVVDLLKSWGYSADDPSDAVTLAIAWGHDLLEDTKVTFDELLDASAPAPDRVVSGIQHLTFDPNGCVTKDKIKATIEAVRTKAATLRCVPFPKRLTAEMLAGFRTTERGCTHPRVGEIDGVKYIAKCGSWSAYSSDEHVHNEFVADNILRAAGLNVPFCREYRVDFHDGRGKQTVRLAKFADDAVPLMEAWRKGDERLRRKICEQAVYAYPVQAWIAGIDTFTYDNVLVDVDGNLVFVDNGASFDFRACGKRKGWFWDRNDIDDPDVGYLSLAAHPDQYVLKTILGPTTDARLKSAAERYDFTALARRLPDSHRTRELKEYSRQLDNMLGAREGE